VHKDVLVPEAGYKGINTGQKILIRDLRVYSPNSADGVDFSISYGYFDNTKNIKYIYFTVVPYNAVGDIQTCQITGKSTAIGKVTGPISSEEYLSVRWETMWYNSTITCVKLIKVEVQYMDGTFYIYVNELPKILDKYFSNKCN